MRIPMKTILVRSAVNEVRGASWYSTGRSGVSIGIGEGRSARGAYHSVGFRIAMILGDGSQTAVSR